MGALNRAARDTRRMQEQPAQPKYIANISS